jgi:hypothetical protein
MKNLILAGLIGGLSMAPLSASAQTVYSNPNFGAASNNAPAYNPSGGTAPTPIYNPGGNNSSATPNTDAAFSAVLGQYALVKGECNPYSIFIYINNKQECFVSGNGSLKPGAYAWQNFQLQSVGGVVGPQTSPQQPVAQQPVYVPATQSVPQQPVATNVSTPAALPYYIKVIGTLTTPVTSSDIERLNSTMSQLDWKPQPSNCSADAKTYTTIKVGIFAICAMPDNFHGAGTSWKIQ